MIAIDTQNYLSDKIDSWDCFTSTPTVYYRSMVSPIEASAARYYQDEIFNPNDWAGQFDQGSFYRDIIEQKFVPLITRYTQSPSVLDVGFGSGKEMKLLLETHPQIRYYGLDFSPSFIRLAKSDMKELLFRRVQDSTREQDRAPILVEANALHMPFRPNSFESAMVLAVMHHIEYCHAEDMIRSLGEILRPNGVVVFSIRKGVGLEYASNGMTYARYSSSEFTDMLHGCGFEIVCPPEELKSKSEVYRDTPYLVFIAENKKCNSTRYRVSRFQYSH